MQDLSAIWDPADRTYGKGKVIKNGPALAGHDAQAVRDAIAGTIKHLPERLGGSQTWDQVAGFAQHTRGRIDTGLEFQFCDPQSPWQRGCNKDTNGLSRQRFANGMDLSVHGTEELNAVAHALNTRPGKTLGWRTPAKAFDQELNDDMIDDAAMTR